jgi:hypothetical protein
MVKEKRLSSKCSTCVEGFEIGTCMHHLMAGENFILRMVSEREIFVFSQCYYAYHA